MSDAVQLAALRVSAEIDAIGVSKGAAEIESAAGRAGAAMKALEGALSAADRAASTSRGIEGLKRQFIDGYGTAQTLERVLRRVSNAVERTGMSAGEASQIIEGAIKRYGALGNSAIFVARNQLELAAATDKANASLTRQNNIQPANNNAPLGNIDRSSQFRRQNLGYQLMDIGQTAALGAPLTMIAMQQGPQIAQLYAAQGGLNAAMKDFGVILMGVARVAGPAIAALGVLYGGYKILQANSVAASLGVSDATRALADQAAPLGSVSGMISELESLQKQYNETLQNSSRISDSATAVILANTKAEYDARKQLLALELELQEAKLATQRADMAIAGQQMKERVSEQVGFDAQRATREGFSDPKINGGIPFVRLPEEISGVQKTMDALNADPANRQIAKMRAEAALTSLELNKMKDALAKPFDTSSDKLANDYWSRYTAAQLTKQRALQNPLPASPSGDNTAMRQADGSRADIAAQVQARQSLLQTQREEADHLQLEIRLIGASARERAVATARLNAEIELRRQGISALSDEGRAYIAKAQAMAAARVETERLNQLAISQDPSGARSNLAAQVQARESLFQSQRDEMAMLAAEAQMIGASTKERAVMMAGMQAEQALRRQGISALSEEGKAYIANAEAMAAARVEIERRNNLALSRDPAGSRADIAGQVQARQQLFQTQANEMESLRLEAQLVGANAQTRARMTAALQAEQALRAQGISSLSKEGQAYVANAQAIAQARLEIERSQAAYQSWQNAGSSAIDALTASTGSLQDRLKGFADAMLSWITQLALANPLKNALFGTNLPTLADLGKPAVPGLSATSTATMTVTAGSVIVNGGMMPGIPGTTTNGGLLSVLGATNGVRPTLTPNGIVNSPVTPTAINGVRPDLFGNGIVNSPVAARTVTAAPPTDIEAYIRQSALARGIDPNIAVRVAQSEGGLQSWNMQSQVFKNGIQEPSYGPFQLLKGGSNTGFPTGLGNDFVNQTGLDPALAANGPQGVDFALDYASRNGWSAWYGARNAGISKWEGIGTNPGVDNTTTNSISSSMQKFTQSTNSAVKGINTLGDSSQSVGSTITDSLGKLAAPVAAPPVPAPTVAAPASGGGIFSSLFGGIFKLFGFADGTDFAPGGRAIVGERGPELVNLPRGSQVIPNHRLLNSEQRMRMPANVRHEFYINVGGNGDAELMGRMQVAADEAAARSVRYYNDYIMPGRVQEVAENPEFVG